MRKGSRKKIQICAGGTAAWACLLAVLPVGAMPGDIFNPGTLGGRGSGGNGINDVGQVTGFSDTAGDTATHAFLYTGMPGSGGTMDDLGTLGGTESVGHAINASGQVVGWSQTKVGDFSTQHAFLYTGTPGNGGKMADLGTLGGKESFSVAINASGQIVGESTTSGNFPRHAFLYTGTPGGAGQMADLGTLGGTYSAGLAINDAGQVTGSSTTLGGAEHAFLYSGASGSGGKMIDLGTLGGTTSIGNAINASGQVTGHSYYTVSNTVPHAFLYTGTPGNGGKMANLGTLGGTRSQGLGINASGQVVGLSDTSFDAAEHAFLFVGTPGVDGVMIDLDTWLDATNPTEGAKWTLREAYGITDAGLITGYGIFDDGPGGLSDGNRAFVLDASVVIVAEPGALALLAVGGVGLVGRRRKPGLPLLG